MLPCCCVLSTVSMGLCVTGSMDSIKGGLLETLVAPLPAMAPTKMKTNIIFTFASDGVDWYGKL